jgi:hypothetical protein
MKRISIIVFVLLFCGVLLGIAQADERYVIKSVSLSLSSVVNFPGVDQIDVVKVRAVIKNEGTDAGMCGIEAALADSRGEPTGMIADNQADFRPGEQKAVDAYVYITHDPAATYNFVVRSGLAVPSGMALSAPYHSQSTNSITDRDLHSLRRPPILRRFIRIAR